MVDVLFRLTIYTGHSELKELFSKRCLDFIPVVGMEIKIHSKHMLIITQVRSILDSNSIICECKLLTPMADDNVIEFIKKFGGFYEKYDINDVMIGGEPLGDKFVW